MSNKWAENYDRWSAIGIPSLLVQVPEVSIAVYTIFHWHKQSKMHKLELPYTDFPKEKLLVELEFELLPLYLVELLTAWQVFTSP